MFINASYALLCSFRVFKSQKCYKIHLHLLRFHEIKEILAKISQAKGYSALWSSYLGTSPYINTNLGVKDGL